MKKFINSVFAFILLTVAFYTLISYAVKPETGNDFMAAMIDKHDRINQLNRPKIIFAGGSNLAFGLNSEEVEKAFSVPVVNLGLHAGFGLNFILNEIKDIAKNGDVVFLSIEYFLDSEGIYKLKQNAGNNYKEARKYYTREKHYARDLRLEILSDINSTRTNLKSIKLRPVPNLKPEIQIYSRQSFNKYGDVVAHLDQTPPNELADRRDYIYKYWTGIDELNEFYNYAKSKNVAVFFIYPNFPETEFKKNKDIIIKLSTDLSDNLKIQILNKPSDFVFPDNLFFDTVYHLNKKGREERTKKLIEIMKNSPEVQRCLQKIDGRRM